MPQFKSPHRRNITFYLNGLVSMTSHYLNISAEGRIQRLIQRNYCSKELSFAEEAVAPLKTVKATKRRLQVSDGSVKKTPKGFAQAYKAIYAERLNAMLGNPDFDGPRTFPYTCCYSKCRNA